MFDSIRNKAVLTHGPICTSKAHNRKNLFLLYLYVKNTFNFFEYLHLSLCG